MVCVNDLTRKIGRDWNGFSGLIIHHHGDLFVGWWSSFHVVLVVVFIWLSCLCMWLWSGHLTENKFNVKNSRNHHEERLNNNKNTEKEKSEEKVIVIFRCQAEWIAEFVLSFCCAKLLNTLYLHLRHCTLANFPDYTVKTTKSAIERKYRKRFCGKPESTKRGEKFLTDRYN